MLFRTFVVTAVFLLFTACDWIGGSFDQEPEDIDQLSAGAKTLIAQAYKNVDENRLIDYHTHMFGLNPENYGTFVNEGWQNPKNIPGYAKFVIYNSAGGISDLTKVDEQFIERLTRLIKYLPYKSQFGLMAFDYFHDEQGRPDKNLSTFHVPNKRMMEVVKQYPEYFFPVISVHPYRNDAIDELHHYARQGVRFIKWLPNAMGINPDPDQTALKEKVEAYYRTMVKYNMVLISHTGDEKATEAEDFQRYGNPLYLKKPLSMGVKVVMSHVASLGRCDEADKAICEPGAEYSDLALEMMRNPEYDGQLYADISATTQYNRKHNLNKILTATDIHHKLVNGSDYPLPAVNFVIQTRALLKAGFITKEQRKGLNEIYDVNPLLFDFVLKRIISSPKTKTRLQAELFMRKI